MSGNGRHVSYFEAAFADYVGARFAIALCNGTATLHTALEALNIGPTVAVPPLTMASTTIAALHCGLFPTFRDVDPETWLMVERPHGEDSIGVSLYGLHYGMCDIDDAAQTLRPHNKQASFTSYSFQDSKILSLGEGGMLTTDDEDLAVKAREFSSLGYRMGATEPRIDPRALKSPFFERHHSLGWNYRMSDIVAKVGTAKLAYAKKALRERLDAADEYTDVAVDCDWMKLQEGTPHDYWTFAVACDTKERAAKVRERMGELGAEVPYPAWLLTYQEPAFQRLKGNACPVAEDLQPRILQFQTNDLDAAKRNASALRQAIKEIG